MIEVRATIDIQAEPTAVAAVMFDPHREPEWVDGVRAVEVMDPGIRPGARVRRAGSWLGQDCSWTTAVVSFHFPHVLELRLTDGPWAGSLAYQVGRSRGGSAVEVRQAGSPVPSQDHEDAAALVSSLRASLDTSLGRLKALVEAAD